VLERDRDAVRRHAVGEVGRAVDGIDDPAGAGSLALAEKVVVGGALFAEELVAWEGGGEDVLDEPLGLLVGLGDEVVRALFADVQRLAGVAADEVAGAAGGLGGGFQFGAVVWGRHRLGAVGGRAA